MFLPFILSVKAAILSLIVLKVSLLFSNICFNLLCGCGCSSISSASIYKFRIWLNVYLFIGTSSIPCLTYVVSTYFSIPFILMFIIACTRCLLAYSGTSCTISIIGLSFYTISIFNKSSSIRLDIGVLRMVFISAYCLYTSPCFIRVFIVLSLYFGSSLTNQCIQAANLLVKSTFLFVDLYCSNQSCSI